MLFLMLPEHQPVISDWSHEQCRSHGREHDISQVQIALGSSQFGEPCTERDSEQETEKHLHAQTGYAQLLQEFSKVAVGTFLS